MNALVVSVLASILLVSACSRAPQEQAHTQPSPSAAASVHTSAQATYSYRCESGETIHVSYPSAEAATVQYKGQSLEMKIAVSGSGSRYTGGGLEWWTKGSGAGAPGTLFHHQTDGTTGDSVEACMGC